MSRQVDGIHNIPLDRALKLNVNGAGNYRVEYDKPSWKLLLGVLKNLGVEDRVNLLSDVWALVQANRAPIALYFELVERLPASTDLAEREQIIHVLDFVNRLLSSSSEHEKFQRYARSLLRPIFDAVGWEAKPHDQVAAAANLRASLITALGNLDDPKIVANCRERFEAFLANSDSLAPDLRPAVLSVVGRYADESTWNELHRLGLKTTSIEEKQNYYDALANAIDPKLVKKTLPIALTDELPTSRAVFLVLRVARESGHPDLAWDFARTNMNTLLAKADALGANRFAPSLFTFFSEDPRAEELRMYAKDNLPAASAPEVAKALDEIRFRSEFNKQLAPQLSAWNDIKNTTERRSPVPDH
jgi:aminopeptidase N